MPLLLLSVTILAIIIYILVGFNPLKEISQQPQDVEQSENLNLEFKKNIQSLA
jgi:uncharacterized membrane protein YuzA (DUF378 family)